MIINAVLPQDLRTTASPTFAGLAFTQATGTAPFTVVSTTKVTYLNADLLDGYDTGTSGDTVPLLSGSNLWSKGQRIEISGVSAGESGFKGLRINTTTITYNTQESNLWCYYTVGPASNVTVPLIAIGGRITQESTATFSVTGTGGLYGLLFDAYWRSSGTCAILVGCRATSYSITGTGTVTLSIGAEFLCGRVSNNGNVTTAIGVRALLYNNNVLSGNVTDYRAFHVDNQYIARAVTGTAYGIYIDTMVGKGATVWSIYSAGGQSSHAGGFRIGSNVAPSVTLDVTGQIYGLSTNQQLRLQYDASNYMGITVNATGSTTLALTGISPLFNFSQGVNVTGIVQLGDGGATDYSKFEANGTLEFFGAATVWEDLRIEPVVRGSGTRNPAFTKWYDDSLGTSRGVYLYDFTNEAVNEVEIFFTMQLPHAWKGTAIKLHVHWVGASTSAGDAKPKWGCEYCWKDIGEVYGDTVIITEDTNTAGDAAITANKHYITAFDSITPGTTADGISSVLIGRIFRNSSDAGDTYDDKVGLLYIDAHYEVNTCGSRDEFNK